MRNGSNTTMLPENDRSQSAVKNFKRWRNLENSTGHLGRGDWKGITQYEFFIWPNTKFRFLLLTIEPFEANSSPEMGRIGKYQKECVPSGERQTTHVYSDSGESTGT
ncbi:hypothetical protein TNCV_4907261 [Trichonephila clavipes]|uniref:Uncharacterized protein n=1 Tax=Trichonephila clavipes TaxID=2585209 RepID=A0A8X6RS72_TRICX|nr:hypothetical protein TNCV_4907261 [Trichonephila clavipes]